MDIKNKFDKVSMFLDGELPSAQMNRIEKIIDTDDDVKEFIVNSAKAVAYSKSFFKNETDQTEVIMLERKAKDTFGYVLKAASIILLVGIGIIAGSIFNPKPGLNPVFTGNIINPAYQEVLNMALENYKSGIPFKGRLPEQDIQITIIPEKTYKYNNRSYLRKFKIIYDFSGDTVNINGFAERKSKESWEIKTLSF
ncbi:MAG: hypothetical protein L3J69_18955 [Desulfobacula sp.]|nr:hypothetical protein [Desulfobacula sp.]